MPQSIGTSASTLAWATRRRSRIELRDEQERTEAVGEREAYRAERVDHHVVELTRIEQRRAEQLRRPTEEDRQEDEPDQDRQPAEHGPIAQTSRDPARDGGVPAASVDGPGDRLGGQAEDEDDDDCECAGDQRPLGKSARYTSWV